MSYSIFVEDLLWTESNFREEIYGAIKAIFNNSDPKEIRIKRY
jgi:hypothetical protein